MAPMIAGAVFVQDSVLRIDIQKMNID